MLFDYDDTNLESIFNYAKKLEGMTFQEVLNEYNNSVQKLYINPREKHNDNCSENYSENVVVENTNAKGQLGNFIERYYFGYFPNGKQEADFSKTGMELKLTCIDKKQNGEYTAGERLSITNISYKEPVEDNFYKSHVWEKIKLILLVHYLRDKSKDRMDYEIKYVNKFTPANNDLNIIIGDYHEIIEKIKQGKAHEISESDTLYLGACTKGATAEKSKVPQYYGDHTLAKKRNFCFKRQYMDYILHSYILKDTKPAESIIVNNELDYYEPFEKQIVRIINSYKGMTDKELCKKFNREYNNNKAQWIDLAYRMLKIKSNKAEEFVKANIVVRAVRVEKNGKIKESLSLPTLNFKEFITETYENSKFCTYFEETKFLFVIYKSNGSEYVLQNAKIWNMPYTDLYGDAKIGWENIQSKIKEGVTFTVEKDDVHNDLPKKNDNRIIHIRPHTSKSAYKLNNGYTKGDISKDGDQLPNGEWMTKQCLWLNNSYLITELDIK